MARVFLVLAFLLALSQRCEAGTRIQRISSPGGIAAWLVESHSVPMVTMALSFSGGASQDPDNKPGVAHFASWMLNEGAGEMRTQELISELRKLGAAYSKSADADDAVMTFASLSKHKDAAFDLLRLMLVAPRFDKDAIARGRKSILADIEAANEDPGSKLGRALRASLFPYHFYGKDLEGTVASLGAITREDLETYRRNTFARDNVTISVVGDIDALQLASLLDKVLGALPAHARLNPVIQAASAASQEIRIEMDLTQSKVAFGYILDDAFTRKEMAAIEILNQILSGGLLISRLDTEIRVKRGLVYSIGGSIYVWQHGAGVLGQFGADPSSVKEALALTQQQLQKLADEGPTEEEIRDAKSSLQDSFLVSLNTSAQLAAHMQWLQQRGFGTNRLDTYASEIEDVTTEELKRVARRAFNASSMSVVIVGKSNS
jgi:zinc protease